MNHVSDILKLANLAIHEQVDAVLATVVHTEGSAYRKAGAMMLICADGRSVGMISGGCLEPHIVKKAFWLTRDGANVQVYQTGESDYNVDHNTEEGGLTQYLKTEHRQTDHSQTDQSQIKQSQTRKHPFEERQTKSYDSFDSDLDGNIDIELNFGLGCNGRVHVLFERLESAMPLLKGIEEVRSSEQPLSMATLIRSEDPSHPVGLHVNLDTFSKYSDTSILNSSSSDLVIDPILKQALTILSSKELSSKELSSREPSSKNSMNKQAEFVCLQGVIVNNIGNNLDHTTQTQWLIRRIQPQIKLLICGAGNDVVPLVTLAKMQDWQVTVVDSRSHYATRLRFIQADKVICLPLEDNERLLTLSRNAAVAIMSHSLTQDRARLKVLLANPPLYLGQLGPKYRTERLIDEIKALYKEDAMATKDPLGVLELGIKQLYYPIGFKLGGEGPEALALGIIAQINAVLHDVQLIESNKHLKASVKVPDISTSS